FFDLCDGKALEAPWAAPDYAAVALQLAEKTGDIHLVNLAKGVAVHSVIGRTQWRTAAKLLAEYRQDAVDCCAVCAGDWLRRQGDLLTEAHDPVLAAGFLDLSAEILGKNLGDDMRGRILFVRSIAHFFARNPVQALRDADEALRSYALSTPRGYFMDTIALFGCFLKDRAERQHYQAALDSLTDFRQRIKGQSKGWHEVRDRLRWVIAQIDAWLGHSRRARVALERTRASHRKHSPHRYALAIALDETLVYCMHRNLPHVHVRSIQGILKSCKQNLKLEDDLKRKLRHAARQLGESPWHARQILVGLRRSFIVPVPSLLASNRPPAESARKRKAAATLAGP
ncbi:MAG: hypothetical protein AAF657_24485, partial [Acidobacteriota bacterium]